MFEYLQKNWKLLFVSVMLTVYLFGDTPFLSVLGEFGHVSVVEHRLSKDDAPVLNNSYAKISQLSGPQIDKGAAMMDDTENVCLVYGEACASLPTSLWMMLLLAYMILLVGNLVYGFRRSLRVQWFWEMIYTVLAILAWYIFDECRIALWYPLYVFKMGVFIFAVYLYFVLQKKDTSNL